MGRNRERGGFTLPELLAVLAIVLILGGVTFAAVFGLRGGARQAACDRAAEAIFMAAQRNLYGLRAAGAAPTDTLVERGVAGSYGGAYEIVYNAYEVGSVTYTEGGYTAVYPAP